MAEIIKTYRQSVVATRFIGKKYGDKDRDEHGGFGTKWGEWHATGLFDVIEKQIPENWSEIQEDGGAYIGLMRWKDGEPFQYWIGMFTPENTVVPEGFGYIDFDASDLGVCWVYGKMEDGEIFCQEEKCAEKLTEEGFEIAVDKEGAYWHFERYACPRFTIPDEKGNVILDICFHVK